MNERLRQFHVRRGAKRLKAETILRLFNRQLIRMRSDLCEKVERRFWSAPPPLKRLADRMVFKPTHS